MKVPIVSLILIYTSISFAQDSLDLYNSCFLRLSNGISVLLSFQDVQGGSKDIINSVTDLASFVVRDSHLTQDEAHEIAVILVDFKAELEKIIRYSERVVQPLEEGSMKDKDKQLLVEGLNQVIYHVFMLAVFKTDVAYHIKYIVSGILKLISYVLENRESGSQTYDVSQVNSILEDDINKKILCYACR